MQQHTDELRWEDALSSTSDDEEHIKISSIPKFGRKQYDPSAYSAAAAVAAAAAPVPALRPQQPSPTSPTQNIRKTTKEDDDDDVPQPRKAIPKPIVLRAAPAPAPVAISPQQQQQQKHVFKKSYAKGSAQIDTSHLDVMKERLQKHESQRPLVQRAKHANFGKPEAFASVQEAQDQDEEQDEQHQHALAKFQENSSGRIRRKMERLEQQLAAVVAANGGESLSPTTPSTERVSNYNRDERIYDNLVQISASSSGVAAGSSSPPTPGSTVATATAASGRPMLVKKVIGKQIDPKWKKQLDQSKPDLEQFFFRAELDAPLPFRGGAAAAATQQQQQFVQPPLATYSSHAAATSKSKSNLRLHLNPQRELDFLSEYMKSLSSIY